MEKRWGYTEQRFRLWALTLCVLSRGCFNPSGGGAPEVGDVIPGRCLMWSWMEPGYRNGVFRELLRRIAGEDGRETRVKLATGLLGGAMAMSFYPPECFEAGFSHEDWTKREELSTLSRARRMLRSLAMIASLDKTMIGTVSTPCLMLVKDQGRAPPGGEVGQDEQIRYSEENTGISGGEWKWLSSGRELGYRESP